MMDAFKLGAKGTEKYLGISVMLYTYGVPLRRKFYSGRFFWWIIIFIPPGFLRCKNNEIEEEILNFNSLHIAVVIWRSHTFARDESFGKDTNNNFLDWIETFCLDSSAVHIFWMQ